ncbi:phage tail protein [Limnobaculum xujianqingii]|uniref:phage tail protein n=1 Tax=Limnobaculum xujianqingii TaxID=2738837 RepID=UPI0015BB1275|nr:phage tail protein [Limnobaculum xujianqingii]
MTSKYYVILTAIGAAKLANATALGAQLEITHMAIGDGGGVVPNPDATQIKLVNECYRAQLNSLSVDGNNQNQIIAEMVLPETIGGWYIRETGLYDSAGDLIAVANAPESYKPQLQEGSGRTQVVRMVLIVSSSTNVSLKIDPAVVLATRQHVEQSISALELRMKTALSDHEESRNHPDATLTNKGLIQLASGNDVFNGINNKKALTPNLLQVKGYFHSQVNKQDISQFTFSDFGRRVWVDSDSPSAFTLPDISKIGCSGQTITIWNVKDANITISVGNESNNISIPMSTVKMLTLKPTESATFIVEQNKVWHATGDGVLKHSIMFGANLAQNGWKREPSGLLTQWGSAIGSNGLSNVTFPIAFSNRPFTIIFGFREGAYPTYAQSIVLDDTATTNVGFRCRTMMATYPASNSASAYFWRAEGV